MSGMVPVVQGKSARDPTQTVPPLGAMQKAWLQEPTFVHAPQEHIASQVRVRDCVAQVPQETLPFCTMPWVHAPPPEQVPQVDHAP